MVSPPLTMGVKELRPLKSACTLQCWPFAFASLSAQTPQGPSRLAFTRRTRHGRVIAPCHIQA
jgi:hypothetical protein